MQEKRTLKEIVDEEILSNPNHLINQHSQLQRFLEINHDNTYRRYLRHDSGIPMDVAITLYLLTINVPLEYFLLRTIGVKANVWHKNKAKLGNQGALIQSKMRQLGLLKEECEI